LQNLAQFMPERLTSRLISKHMSILVRIQEATAAAASELYASTVEVGAIQISPTPKEFSGNYSVVVFPFVRFAKLAPEAVAVALGKKLVEEIPQLSGYNVVKGFLNLSLSATYWTELAQNLSKNEAHGVLPRNGKKVLFEYSSPNTNKPLHLGHVRNCLLGWSCVKLLNAVGYDVHKIQIINDRGVHICKSMLMWKLHGEGKTPESEGIKGDHFVGDYYVLYEKESKAEYSAWQASPEATEVYLDNKKADQTEEDFFKAYKKTWEQKFSKLSAQVNQMLLDWEANDPETRAIWSKMNSWVYAGFDATYERMGVAFDQLYYESDVYGLGKDVVAEGVAKGAFYVAENGATYVDLSGIKADPKVVLRSNGTSTYITQDLGLANARYNEHHFDKMIYVVADEQNDQFKALFEALRKLEAPFVDALHHLNYGLVELPTGRMKTREGTVVDADDLMDEIARIAHDQGAEGGTLAQLSPEEQTETVKRISLAALKFFILKVNPKKRMIFNPEESLDMQGQTGPYIQYSYVRINGLLKRAALENIGLEGASQYTDIQEIEQEMLLAIDAFPEVIRTAADEFDPSHLANYCYNLAKNYHRFWHDVQIFNAPDAHARAFRLQLSQLTGRTLKTGMELLGIEMPERM
jgi:arginyl-tRNA synthetase